MAIILMILYFFLAENMESYYVFRHSDVFFEKSAIIIVLFVNSL